MRCFLLFNIFFSVFYQKCLITLEENQDFCCFCDFDSSSTEIIYKPRCEIASLSCIIKKEKATYIKKVFVIENPNVDNTYSDGTIEKPYQSLGQAFLTESATVIQYNDSVLEFVLGSPHFYFKISGEERNYNFFRDIKVNLSLGPGYCNEYSNFRNCLSPGLRPTIFFKSSNIIFYIGAKFKLKNIILDGRDIGVGANEQSCLICCNDSALSEDYTYNKKCGINKKEISNNTELRAVFNLEGIYLWSNQFTAPQLIMENIDIINFNLIYRDDPNSLGSLVKLSNYFQNNIIINNLTLSTSVFSYLIILDDDFFSSGNSEFNTILSDNSKNTKLFLSVKNLFLLNFNSLKLVSRNEDIKSIFYFSNINAINILFQDCLLYNVYTNLDEKWSIFYLKVSQLNAMNDGSGIGFSMKNCSFIEVTSGIMFSFISDKKTLQPDVTLDLTLRNNTNYKTIQLSYIMKITIKTLFSGYLPSICFACFSYSKILMQQSIMRSFYSQGSTPTTLFYSESTYQVSNREQFNDYKKGGNRLAVDELVIEDSSFLESTASLSFLANIRSLYIFMLRNCTFADLNLGLSVFCYITVESQFSIINTVFKRLIIENHYFYITPVYQILFKDSIFTDINLNNSALVICRSSTTANDDHFIYWLNVEFRNVYFTLMDVDFYQNLGEGNKLGFIVIRYEVQGDGMVFRIENSSFSSIQMNTYDEDFIFFQINSPKFIFTNSTVLNITNSIIIYYFSTDLKGSFTLRDVDCNLSGITKGFLKTSAEFFESASFYNFTVTGLHVFDKDFIQINGVNNFTMMKCVFKLNIVNGGILNINVISLKNLYIADSLFKNLPSEGSRTRGIILGTKNTSEDLGYLKTLTKESAVGIFNCSFENFDYSTLIIDQDSVLYINGLNIIAADYNSALDIKARSSLVMENFLFKNLSVLVTGAAIVAQSANLLLLNGLIVDISSLKGGGSIVAQNCLVFLQNVNFTNLKAKAGGAVFVESSDLVVVSCLFYKSNVEKNGGFINIKYGKLIILDTNFTLGQAGAKGGCILSEECDIFIIKCNFEESSTLKTGVLMMMGGENTKGFLVDCSFVNNYAKSSPAFSIMDMRVYSAGIKINNNKGAEKLIEVFTSFAQTSLVINNFTIEGNNVIEGNLLYSLKSDLYFLNGAFINNSIGLDHLYFVGYNLVNVIYVQFQAIMESNGSKIKNFGFINTQSKSLNIFHSSFMCEHSISGVRATNAPFIFLLNCTIERGFAIYGSAIKLSNSNFLGDSVTILNSTTALSGAFYAEEFGSLILNNFVFSLNKVWTRADGVSISDVFLKNSERSIVLNKKNPLAILYNNIFKNISSISFYSELTKLVLTNIYVSTEISNSNFLTCINCLSVFTFKIFLENLYGLGGLSFETVNKKGISTDLIIKNSIFSYLLNYRTGGGLYINGAVNALITASTFLNCESVTDGGAIYYYCFGRLDCKMILENKTIFVFNKAGGKGGALFTYFFQVQYDDNDIVLEKNNANIGDDFASSPFSIFLVEGKSSLSFAELILNKTTISELKTRPSYQFSKKLGNPLVLNILIIDNFNNILYDLDGIFFQIRITNSPIDSFPELINNLALLTNGVGHFGGLEIFAKYSDFTLQASIESLKPLSGVIIKEQIEINLTTCEIGDIFTGSSCLQCPTGFYSLDVSPLLHNITECKVCPPNANCANGLIKSLEPGYWRVHNLSDIVVGCINELACPNLDILEPHSCGAGYFGNFCGYCAKGYVSISSKCEACYEGRMLTGFLLPYILFFILLALSRGDVNSDIPSAELRFVTNSMINHLSYLMIIGIFNLDWQLNVKEILNLFNYYISPSSQNIFSFGCFMSFIGSKEILTSMVLTTLSPLLYLVVFLFQMELLIWIKNFLIKRGLLRSDRILSTFSSFKRFRKDVKLYFFLIFFNLYPTLIIQTLRYLNCVEIEPGVSYMEISPDVPCNTEDKEYLFFLSLVALCLLFWGLGIPFLIFILSRKQIKKDLKLGATSRELKQTKLRIQSLPFNNPSEEITNNLNVKKICINSVANSTPLKASRMSVFRRNSHARRDSKSKNKKKKPTLGPFLVAGYSKKFYFWESLIYLRKFFIILVSLLQRHLDARSLAGLIIIVFFLFFFVNQNRDIFINKNIKNLESASLIVTIFTLGFGLMASYGASFEVFKTIYLSIVFFVNFLFFIMWVVFLWRLKLKDFVRKIRMWHFTFDFNLKK